MDNDKYLDMNEDDIDNLIYGLNIEEKPKSNDKNTCKNCKSTNLVTDNIKGYMVCTDCAVINNECLDNNPDLINNDGENNNNSRYGTPTSFFFPKSAMGSKVTGYNRISLLQRQGQMPYKEKSLRDVLEIIQAKCKKYNITQTIIDSSKILYKKISEALHTKGKRKGKNIIMRCVNRRSMIAACLFHACKLQKETRSPKEIADIYSLEIKNVNRGIRKFCDIIDINTNFYQNKSSESTDFIERFGKRLNLDKKYIDIAKDVSNNINKLDLATTHEPPSIAAGCILLVATHHKIQLTKKQISDIFGISAVTISKTYSKILLHREIILNNEITNYVLGKQNNDIQSNTVINVTDLIISNNIII